MLISRALTSLTRLNNLHKISQQSIRNHGGVYNYRCPAPQPSKQMLLAADIVQGTAWWWVLWHLWTEPEHIFGEFDYPDPSKWTDEELGIPS